MPAHLTPDLARLLLAFAFVFIATSAGSLVVQFAILRCLSLLLQNPPTLNLQFDVQQTRIVEADDHPTPAQPTVN